MKIVHLCLCGPMTDGWNYQENMLSKYHRKNGLDVTVIASQWIWGNSGKKEKTDKTGYINEDGVKMIRLPLYFGDVDTRLKIYKGVRRTLEEENPDYIFIHDVQFLDVLSIRSYLKKRNRENRPVKAFADNHVDFSNGARNWLSKNVLHKIIWKLVVRSVNPYVEQFYGVLPARVDFLQEMYGLPREKCELLVMGGDDEEIKKAADEASVAEVREKLGIAPNDFLIMTGGKIDAFKTQTLLLMEAVSKIETESARLVVFGSVSDELKEKVDQLSDGHKVQYIGWIDAKDSYRYFAASDLVIFPGRHSVFWEQVAAQGIPMVCKSWKGTKHVDIGGNVVFLEEDSVHEIQKVIGELTEDHNKYDKMKQIAESEGKKVFSYEEIARRSIGETK